ncbi:hypothetical protein [Mycobacterium bourgelatii]|uniref:Uncharacterized protein n=1 Tax=Mycobacterium bourgelatii TaxID=1273442 RepID=A0A7I9YHG8_MYCBU|nr:hypothetical protein [Mycobacterium bourgelatii]MCV6975317.1 hypothetical protein [Mycobacterium bourgelatii]GFG88094.1 hypothetical protein MBOU_01360 [Mycobacterium bourgelatii]
MVSGIVAGSGKTTGIATAASAGTPATGSCGGANPLTGTGFTSGTTNWISLGDGADDTFGTGSPC